MSQLEMTVEALKLCVDPDVFAAAMKKAQNNAHHREEKNLASNETNVDINNLLLDIGVPTHLKGYPFASTGIRLLVKHPEMGDSITKELYPEIARIHNTTKSRVERAIRTAVEVAFNRGDVDVIYRYFRNSINAGRGKPTNAEFLTRMAYEVKNRANIAA